MDAWQRIPEDENLHCGERSIAFPIGNKSYKVDIDEAQPFRLFVTYQSKSWTWPMEVIEESGKQFQILGLAFAEEPVLSGTCGFVLHCNETSSKTYWGDQVLVREDHSI